MSARTGASAGLLLALGCAPPAPEPQLGASSAALEGARIERIVTALGAVEDDYFGGQLAFSEDKLLVSVTGGVNQQRAAVTFVHEGDAFRQEFVFLQHENEKGVFGRSVGITKNHYVVATVTANAGELGVVHLFSRTTGDGGQVIFAGDYGDEFGSSIGTAGDVIAIGAPGEDDHAGAVYIYQQQSSGGYKAVQRLLASPREQYRRFGQDLGIAASTLVISAERSDSAIGEAFVFEPSVSGWMQVSTLSSQVEPSLKPGLRVATDGESVLVGDFHDEPALHVFTWEQSWKRRQTLYNFRLEPSFGKSLAVEKGLAVASARDSAQVYVRSDGTWSEQARLRPSNPSVSSRIEAVAISGGFIALGAPTATVGSPPRTGAVLIFGPCAKDEDCLSSHYCGNDGFCHEQKLLGASCEGGCKLPGCRLCGSGHCVDGVCCVSACDRTCEACAESGMKGQCVVVAGTPRGSRTPCGGHPVCAGACDGHVRDCAYVPRQTACASRCTSDGEISAACDGQGACVESEVHACGNYACVAGGCRLFCADPTDCADGFECISGTCAAIERARCSGDGRRAISPLGDLDCGSYQCDPATGACLSACAVTTQCAPNRFCDPASRNCLLPGATRDDGACSCRVDRARLHGLAGGSLLVMGLLSVRRRSRRLGGRTARAGLGGLLLKLLLAARRRGRTVH